MKGTFDTRQAAAYLGVSFWTLVKWRSLGKGPIYRKFGGKTGRARYRIADLDAFKAGLEG